MPSGRAKAGPYGVDLHTHSTASDGIYSPGELLQRAHAAGLRVLALTDHDSTNGVEEAAQASLRGSYDIEFIPGIEINTDGSGGEMHVLGYFPEYWRPAFQAVLQVLRDARVRRGERMVKRLNEGGVHITWERVRQIAQGAVGRPHIAQALMEAGYVQSMPEAFEKYLCTGCPAYVPRYKLTVEDAIHLIASANGLPVLAHPAELLGRVTVGIPVPQTGFHKGLPIHSTPCSPLRSWLPRLCEVGMVGLETYYGQYTEETVSELRRLADEYHLVPTGGSDFHGPGIHPTPLGGHAVPYESVERLKALAKARHGQVPPAFTLPPPAE
jgi:3',5'-nucleoside bisphosphate phosphatase